MELEYRTEKLAACVTTLTGDMEGIKQQREVLIGAARNHQSVLGTIEGTIQNLIERMQHFETAIAHISRQQVSLESTLALALRRGRSDKSGPFATCSESPSGRTGG